MNHMVIVVMVTNIHITTHLIGQYCDECGIWNRDWQ